MMMPAAHEFSAKIPCGLRRNVRPVLSLCEGRYDH
jgi:hypothetical protein